MTIRPSSTALAAAGRAIAARRDPVVREWAEWIESRSASTMRFNRGALRRQLALFVDVLVEMSGSRRRPALDLWLALSEWFGQTAAARGLATGEVVEEFQHLRELLIRDLSEFISSLPARQSIATVLRLNRFLDQGIAHAVVGYTDALVETLLYKRGVPVGAVDAADAELELRLTHMEEELARIRATGESDGG